MNRSILFRGIFGIALLALGWVAWSGMNAAKAAEGVEDLKGKPAPDFSLKTTGGEDVKLADLKGKVVVLDFWATWCPPCRLSLPHIQALSANKEDREAGLRVLAVNAREAKEKIESFLNKNNYTFTTPMDSEGAVMGTYKITGIPTTIVVGRDGVVRDVFVGFDPQDGGKMVDAAVEAALKEKAQ